MTAREIVTAYLKEHGFDGLYYDWCCGCAIGNLGTCSKGMSGYCQPGYKEMQPGGGWVMVEEKPGRGSDGEAASGADVGSP